MKINGKGLCDNCFEEITKEPCPLCGFAKSTYHPVIGVLPVGTVLKKRYHIGKVLGVGGFGVTYKAYDTLMKCPVAVKEYYPSGMVHRDTGTTEVSVRDQTLSEDFRSGAEKFSEEAKMISRFNGNPNIVGVYDYFQENGTAYFIMEYLDGMDLKHYIKLMGGKLTQENVVHIARAVSDALLITHSMNVLHRDISPDNIYITSDGRIKLIDFGAARQVMSQQSKSMSVILKQGFAPFEQYQRKGRQGSWTDIYALGATMYYAITGKIPEDATERLEEPDLGNAEDYGVDPELWAVIDKCMAVRIADRYEEIVDLKRALNKLPIQEAELTKIPKPQPAAGAPQQVQAAPQQNYEQPQTSQPEAAQQQAPMQADGDRTVAFGGDTAGVQQPQVSQPKQAYAPQPQVSQPEQAYAQPQEGSQSIWRRLFAKSQRPSYVGMIVSIAGLLSCLFAKMIRYGGEPLNLLKFRYPMAVLFALALLCLIFRLNWIALLPAAASLAFVCYYLQPHSFMKWRILFINYWYWGMLFSALSLPVAVFAAQGKLFARKQKIELKWLRRLGVLTAIAGSFLAGHGSFAGSHAYQADRKLSYGWYGKQWEPIRYQLAIVLFFLLAAVILCTGIYYIAGAAAAVSLALICKNNAYVIGWGIHHQFGQMHKILYGLMTPVAVALTALSVILVIAKIVIVIKKAGSKKAVNG